MAYTVATQQGLNGQGPDLVALWVKIWWFYMLYIHIHPWNPNDSCFCSKRPCFEGFTSKNTGHLDSRSIFFLLNSKALLDTPQREFVRPLAPSSVVFMELFRCLSCK